MYSRHARSRRSGSFWTQLKNQDRRIAALVLFFAVFCLMIVWRLGKLQIFQADFYSSIASGQYDVYQDLFPERGTVYVQNTTLPLTERYKDENLYATAANRMFTQIYAVPYDITDPSQTADTLADILFNETAVLDELTDAEREAMKPEATVAYLKQKKLEYRGVLFERVSKKNDPYEPIKRKADDALVEKVRQANLPGIAFADEPHRYYPEANLGSHVIGFVGNDSEGKLRGLYGLERYFEDELAGVPGYLRSERDGGGGMITISDSDFRPSLDGADIVLTIDHQLQNFTCEKLDEGVKKYEAEGGSAIIMDPSTGAIRALCGFPDFDPNNYGYVDDIAVYNNPAIVSAYEPGSIFKPITLAAGLDLEKITPQTTYEDTGTVQISGHTIQNSDKKAHGIVSMIEVLKQSLNTGTIFVVEQTGRESFLDYVKKFGFGVRTEVTLPSENPGDISALSQEGKVYTYTASFGQGITATPLQMVNAFAAIANGGVLKQPYIVDQIRYSTGVVDTFQPKDIRQVISKNTSTILSSMLVTVVNDGHAKQAALPGYKIAGKTGTAQAAENGKYQGRTVHSFVGFAPVDAPAFVMIVRLDNPQKGKFAESTAVPVFAEIEKYIFQYYQIPPGK